MNSKNIRLVWRNSGENRISGISGVGDEWVGGYAGMLHGWAAGTCRRVGLRG